MSLIFLSQRFSLCLEFEEIYDITPLFRKESGGKQNPVLHLPVYMNVLQILPSCIYGYSPFLIC